MPPTIATLALGRFLRTLAAQLHRVEVSPEYKRGYCDALAGVASLAGLHDAYLPRATVAGAELPKGYDLEVRQ